MESEISTAQTRERKGSPGPSDADCQREEGLMSCSLVSNTNCPKTLLGTRMHPCGILVCSPDLSIGDYLETDAGFV